MAMLSTQQTANLTPTKMWQRQLTRQVSAAAATAQTFNFDLPRDHFIHEVHITIYESTSKTTYSSGDLADKLTDAASALQIVANGNKYLKDMTASMDKTVILIEGRKTQTGHYLMYFTAPSIPSAQPLPSWIFTSLRLNITDVAPAASNFHMIDVVVVESAYNNQDLSNWRVLIEKYLLWAHWGANTGQQQYTHERAYAVFGYVYMMDDNGTLKNTTFNNIKVLARKPEGELTVIDVPVTMLITENNAEIGLTTLLTGFCFLVWEQGFPANEYSSLYSYLNIPTAGTNASVRVLERYTL